MKRLALAVALTTALTFPSLALAQQTNAGRYGTSEPCLSISERSSLNIGFSYSNGKALGGVGYSIIID